MATNNNDARDKQKRTEAGDSDGNSSLPTTPAIIVSPVLSLGTILIEFQDFLFCLLPYIADRVIWNSIASSNKDMHEKSKAIQPPWPLCYKLPSAPDTRWSWSPCGTRIACSVNGTDIVIVDQRRGRIRNNGHINAHNGCYINDMKYSPNGRFLVSTGDDCVVKLWDTTGNYEQIQAWNMPEEVINQNQALTDYSEFSISACSKYIVVPVGTCVFLTNVENGGTIKSSILPFAPNVHIAHTTTRFSSDGRAVFLCSNFSHNDIEAIKVWRPYLDDDDEGRLITLWREVGSTLGAKAFEFSHDNTMVVIHKNMTQTGILWSIDTDQKSLTKIIDFQGSAGLHFTPDDKYIVVNKENGPTLWSIAEGKYTNNTIHFLDNGNNTEHNLYAWCFSSNNRQLIIQELGDQELGDHYITSYFVK